MIQVAVNRVQVLDDRKSHISFIFEQQKVKPTHNKRKTVSLKAFTDIPSNFPQCTPCLCQGFRTGCVQLEEKKKILRGGLIVYSVWNSGV